MLTIWITIKGNYWLFLPNISSNYVTVMMKYCNTLGAKQIKILTLDFTEISTLWNSVTFHIEEYETNSKFPSTWFFSVFFLWHMLIFSFKITCFNFLFHLTVWSSYVYYFTLLHVISLVHNLAKIELFYCNIKTKWSHREKESTVFYLEAPIN